MNDFIKMPSIGGLQGFYRFGISVSLALGLAVALVDDAFAKAKPRKAAARPIKAAPAHLDPINEWEIIAGEAVTLRNAGGSDADDAQIRQKLAELALRAARAAERALSRGDEDLFNAYREQIAMHFVGTGPALEKMADRGIGLADYALGTLALHGILEERNVERACARFAAALNKGFGGAKFRHAQCIEESAPERATALLQEAADSGHIAASERLGRFCLDASPPDADCARKRLGQAASEGRASAKTLLGWMYAEGIGGKPDFVRAAKYYRDAAQQGEPSARNNLGELYENGRGVAKDEKKAFDYYRAAAESGFPPAQFNLGRLFAAGKGTAQNRPEARRWLGEAAKAGIAPAQTILGMLDQEAGN